MKKSLRVRGTMGVVSMYVEVVDVGWMKGIQEYLMLLVFIRWLPVVLSSSLATVVPKALLSYAASISYFETFFKGIPTIPWLVKDC